MADNIKNLHSLFDRTETVSIQGLQFQLKAPSAEDAAKIDIFKSKLAKHINPKGEVVMSDKYIEVARDYQRLCVSAVVGCSVEDAKRAMVVVPGLTTAVSEFLDSPTDLGADPT